MTDFSRTALIQFLDYLGDKGLMNPQTASARKASANSLLSILDDEEAKDVTKLDIDHVVQRFLNLKGTEVRPDSVKVYKGRVESAIRDFIAYKTDPLSFKPKLDQRGPRNSEPKAKDFPSSGLVEREKPAIQSPTIHTENVVFPIPIRSDVTIKIAGIPPDLSPQEAKKIANVLMALATNVES